MKAKKKMLFLVITLLFITTLVAEEFDSYNPNVLTICFSADLVGNTRGELAIQKENGFIKTPFEWFNNVAIEYQVIELERKYVVKDQEWNLDGIYPMNIYRLVTSNHNRSNELLSTLRANNNVLFVEYEPITTFDSTV